VQDILPTTSESNAQLSVPNSLQTDQQEREQSLRSHPCLQMHVASKVLQIPLPLHVNDGSQNNEHAWTSATVVVSVVLTVALVTLLMFTNMGAKLLATIVLAVVLAVVLIL
jgi:hypothetical protein